jgi:hypothetical protein
MSENKPFLQAEVNSMEDVKTLRAGGQGLTAQVSTALTGIQDSYKALVEAFLANDSEGVEKARLAIGEYQGHLDSVGSIIQKALAFEKSQTPQAPEA